MVTMYLKSSPLFKKVSGVAVGIFAISLLLYGLYTVSNEANALVGEGTVFEGIVPTDYIWVDDDAPDGGDGTLSNPYDTISEAVAIADAGTAILVRSGTYNEKVKFPSRTGGTASAPIWLISVDGYREAIINAPAGSSYTIQGLGAQNIVVEGFEIMGPATRGMQFGMSGNAADDYTLWDNPLTQPKNIVIRGNYIHATGTDDGIKIHQASYIEILDNTIITSPNGEDCIDVLAGDYVTISHNDCDGSYEAAAISIKGGSRYGTTTYNYIHDNIVYPASAIGLGGQGSPAELYRPDTVFDVSDWIVQYNKIENMDGANLLINIRGAANSDISENYLDGTGQDGGYVVYAWSSYRGPGETLPALTSWPENLTITDNVYGGPKTFYGDHSSVDVVADNITVADNTADLESWSYTVGPRTFTPTVSASFPDTVPFVSLSLSATTISLGNSANLTWSSANVTSCTGTNFSTSDTTSGSVSVSPTVDTTYTISCTGDDGDAETSVAIIVNGAPLQDETTTLIEAMDTEPSQARQDLYNELIADLKSAGVWTKLDALYIMAAHDSQAASLNIKNPGTYDLTAGGGSPTFTEDAYYSFNGSTDWLDTNFNPATAGGNYEQDSATIGIWSATSGTRQFSFGFQVNNTTGGAYMSPHTSGDRWQFQMNSGTNIHNIGNSGNPWTNSTGLFALNRSGSAAVQAYWNGAAQTIQSSGATQVSSALNSNSFRIGMTRAASQYGAIDAPAAFIGGSLTSGEHDALYDAIDSYLTAVEQGDVAAPSVSVTAPTNGATVSGASVTLTATATDDEGVVGVQFKLGATTLLGSEDTESPYSVTWDSTAVEDDVYSILAVARDAVGNYATSTITVTVDNSTPSLSDGGPVGAQEAGITEVSLTVTTDENATCRYSTSSNTAYGSMSSFSTTGGGSHSTTISDLTAASYTYYVRCQDGQGNTNTSDYSISFTIPEPEPVITPTPTLRNNGANIIIDGGKIRIDH